MEDNFCKEDEIPGRFKSRRIQGTQNILLQNPFLTKNT